MNQKGQFHLLRQLSPLQCLLFNLSNLRSRFPPLLQTAPRPLEVAFCEIQLNQRPQKCVSFHSHKNHKGATNRYGEGERKLTI